MCRDNRYQKETNCVIRKIYIVCKTIRTLNAEVELKEITS